MRLKVAGHRLLIKPDSLETVSKGGIVLAVNEKIERAATQSGVIVDIGETAWHGFADSRPWAKIGDHVVFARYSHKVVTDPDNEKDEYFVINDDDVQVIIEKKETSNG